MAIQDIEKDNNLWFFTHTGEEHNKVDKLEQSPSVQVSVVSKPEQLYYSINGKSSVVTNQEKIDKYWNSVAKVWFPNGKRRFRIDTYQS
ncbi:MAG: general stress protein 26 [Spirosomataceae bacterium]